MRARLHTPPSLLRWLMMPGFVLAAAAPLRAQSVSADTTKTLFVKRDLALTAAAVAGTAVVSIFDKRVARYAQSTSIQSASRTKIVKKLTKVNETTLTAASILGYGVGRLTHSPSVADVSLHAGESIVLTSVISQLIRGPLGRTRPSVDINDPYHFQPGNGFTHFDNRSFPSLHSATAFAAAAALSGELRARNPDANWVLTPLLYAGASIPGLTRIYLNQHWASDVVAGAFVGTLIGNRVVHYSHTHRRTKFDRALLGVSITPGAHGGFDLSYSMMR